MEQIHFEIEFKIFYLANWGERFSNLLFFLSDET